MFLLAFLLLGLRGVIGNHFRGGAMSWRAISNTQVELTYYVSYKFHHSEPRFDPCTVEAVSDQRVLRSGGDLACEGCLGEETERPMDYICTSYDLESDWAIGYNKVIYEVPSDGNKRLSISYKSCCWIRVASPDTGRGARAWNLQTDVNMNPRPDGKINSSPVTTAVPIEKYHIGCAYDLQIAVSDPDNDIIKCRDMVTNECHSDPGKRRSCGKSTSGLTVNKNCTLRFDARVAGEGAHAVNIMIRDCPNKRCKQSYSNVPLLFLLNVTGSGEECIKPNIIIPPGCNTVPPNQLFEMNITAEAGNERKPISRITSSRPRGMNVSEMRQVEGSPTRKVITLSWSPTDEDLGEHSMCFSALDSDGFTSGRYCTFIRVSDQPSLVPDLESSTPALGAEHGINDKWTIRFNQEIQRPRKPGIIRITSKSGEEVFRVLSTSRSVTFVGDAIEFTPPSESFGLASSPIPVTLYLDEGVALPAGGGCGSEPAKGTVYYMKDKTAFAILPNRSCKSSRGPADQNFFVEDKGHDHQCDIFLKEIIPDANGGPGIPTSYNLCCTCYDGPSMPYEAGPPGGDHGRPPGRRR